MDLFRKSKKSGGAIDGSLHVDDVNEETKQLAAAENSNPEEVLMKSIEDLVDFDDGEADIFDDDEDELETPSKSVTGSVSSNAGSFKEAVQTLAATGPFLTIPTTVQPVTMIDLVDASDNSDKVSLGNPHPRRMTMRRATTMLLRKKIITPKRNLTVTIARRMKRKETIAQKTIQTMKMKDKMDTNLVVIIQSRSERSTTRGTIIVA